MSLDWSKSLQDCTILTYLPESSCHLLCFSITSNSGDQKPHYHYALKFSLKEFILGDYNKTLLRTVNTEYVICALNLMIFPRNEQKFLVIKGTICSSPGIPVCMSTK